MGMRLFNVLNDQNPRTIAARILGRRSGGDYVEHLLEKTLGETILSGPDRALCQELVYGVVRWQATLDWLIDRKTGGRVQKPALQTLLYAILIIVFLVAEPNGLAGIWRRVRDYFATWPLAKRGS